jgi:hypothetical protein
VSIHQIILYFILLFYSIFLILSSIDIFMFLLALYKLRFRNGKFRIAVLNLLKPTGHVMHQQFNIQLLYVLPTLYLCVLYLSENKQRLVPLTA